MLFRSISNQGLTQLRIAETEKYPHVTFFFNGGEEKVFAGEDRILVPSPKVETYDLQPEMSAYEVTEKLEEAILSKKYNAIIYADADDAHYEKNPAAYKITRQVVDSKTVLSLKLAPGGGCAVSIVPVK